MPKTVGEFLNELAQKAGVKIDDENLKNALSAPDLQKITIPDELITGIDNGLLSIENAKNNHPEIKKHYMAQAFNGLDAELESVMNEMQIGDDVKNVILNERSSTKRAALLPKKIRELEQKKDKATSDATKESLQKQINELQAQLAGEKQSVAQIKEQHQKELQQIKTQTKIESLLSGYKTKYDDLDLDIKINALNAILQKSLQDSNARLTLDENGTLVLRREDGSNVFGDDHRLLNPETFINKALSQKKVLVVTPTADPKVDNKNQQGNNGSGIIVNTGTTDNGKKIDTVTSNLIQKQLADLEKAEEYAK